jgi:hypothetical protein
VVGRWSLVASRSWLVAGRQERWLNRIEIEMKLSRDRAGLLERFAALSADELARGVTPSEHDPQVIWTPLDHLAHLAGIERAFNAMVRRHLAGEANPVALAADASGAPRSREQILAAVHASNERFVAEHRGGDLSAIVALGEAARAETLALLAELTEEQLAEKLPGAPWADGTIGGVLATNGDHGRQHWAWLRAGLEARDSS